jgi:hypothetical protein
VGANATVDETKLNAPAFQHPMPGHAPLVGLFARATFGQTTVGLPNPMLTKLSVHPAVVVCRNAAPNGPLMLVSFAPAPTVGLLDDIGA